MREMLNPQNLIRGSFEFNSIKSQSSLCLLKFHQEGDLLHIIWSIGTCYSLTRTVLDFGFHRRLCSENEPLKSRIDRVDFNSAVNSIIIIRSCMFKSADETLRVELCQRVTLRFLHNQETNAHGLIVWSISRCPSLTRTVLDFEFHKRLSLENGSLSKSNWSNRFQFSGRFYDCFPILYVQIL
jgi:hypothetical protein